MSRARIRIIALLAAAVIVAASGIASAQPKPTLKIGVTLHPYYSWTKNVVGDTVKIRLTSDASVVYWGFRVTNVTAGSGGGDTTPPTVSISSLTVAGPSARRLTMRSRLTSASALWNTRSSRRSSG